MLKMRNIFATILCIFIIISMKTIANAKFYSVAIARDRLLSDLFVDYNPSSRPGKRGMPTNVSVNLEIQHFDYRESDGAFNIIGKFNAAWCDKKLSWNPKDYNDVKGIAINQRLVWIPDLEFYNNAPDKFLRMHRNGYVILNYEGNMTWSDAIDLTIFCSTNMLHWPHDNHICHLTLASWVHSGYDLNITNDENTMISFDNDHIQNVEYEITKYSAKHETTFYSCCEEPYITIKYEIEFRRKTEFSKILYLPAYTIMMLTFLALALKPNRGEKILLNGMNFIIITLQLLYFTKSIAKFARGTPYIVVFYSSSLIVTTFTHLICVFALWTNRSIHNDKFLPVYISKFLKSSFAQYFASNQLVRTRNENEYTQFEDVKLSDCSSLIPNEANANEWIRLALLLERLTIIIISIVYLILATTCLT